MVRATDIVSKPIDKALSTSPLQHQRTASSLRVNSPLSESKRRASTDSFNAMLRTPRAKRACSVGKDITRHSVLTPQSNEAFAHKHSVSLSTFQVPTPTSATNSSDFKLLHTVDAEGKAHIEVASQQKDQLLTLLKTMRSEEQSNTLFTNHSNNTTTLDPLFSESLDGDVNKPLQSSPSPRRPSFSMPLFMLNPVKFDYSFGQDVGGDQYNARCALKKVLKKE